MKKPSAVVSSAMMEALAADEHDRWSGQARTALDEMTPERRERWDRLSKTPYAELPEEMKELDRMQVRERLAIMGTQLPQPAAPVQPSAVVSRNIEWWYSFVTKNAMSMIGAHELAEKLHRLVWPSVQPVAPVQPSTVVSSAMMEALENMSVKIDVATQAFKKLLVTLFLGEEE